MPRAKRGFKARRRRNRVLKAASGFRGKRNSCHAIANEGRAARLDAHVPLAQGPEAGTSARSGSSASTPRARGLGQSYSKLMGKLGTSGISLNRKMLAEIAISDPVAFQKIAKRVGESPGLSAPTAAPQGPPFLYAARAAPMSTAKDIIAKPRAAG